MRYLGMTSMTVITIIVLFIVIRQIRDEWIYEYMPEWGLGYFVGSIGMTTHHTIIYKWYKREL